ncbi:serine/threonine protein phosphatase [Histoplasma capsulatum var. duboisii H88]|uniref:Serine/threonine protein phosphatase n=2 Tax=Ajellomyces capsulatus TaxID=5037 RepID=F0U8Y4_AJEC8|nr:serine/threonine protein phosphatase [Histoplasma capsulatum H143]EGC40986.1 serine/threonine protein phosphatase [Histoplasma capsulatum var. duboisii H88]
MVRTRIVCISDTHGYGPPDGAFKLPKGDVLVHAGDLSNQGTLSELRKTAEWIERADFEVKIGHANMISNMSEGNHDITLDGNFYKRHWQSFHNQRRESADDCQALFTKSSIVYLNHESAVIRLSNPGGPQSIFKIFGSPYTPYCGKWAFSYTSEEACGIWDKIPLDTDIVLTHTPPRSHCDENRHDSLGCEHLRQALWRVRPRLAICGHVHEGRGYDRVLWDIALQSGERFKELSSVRGELPPLNSKKQCLIDLTGKTQPRLRNDAPLGSSSPTLRANDESQVAKGARTIPGRNETCIVNAAIMATSWPHRDGKKFNSPLVVDLDLPVAG